MRSVGLPDLLLAAVAEREHVTVLHYDADYHLVAQITNQPVRWVVPRGTVPYPIAGTACDSGLGRICAHQLEGLHAP